jgi:hypothetical protein
MQEYTYNKCGKSFLTRDDLRVQTIKQLDQFFNTD